MFRRYRQLDKGEFILVFADTAVGGADWCAAQFLSADKLDIPIVYHSNSSATMMTPLLHRELESIYDVTQVQPVIAYERNNGGQFELERLSTLNRLGKYFIYEQKDATGKPNGKIGWDTNAATRPKMLQELQECINNKLIIIYDKPTVTELFQFVIFKSGRPEAEAGSHDDLVMSLAGVWQLYQTERRHEKVNYQEIMTQLVDEQLFSDNGLY